VAVANDNRHPAGAAHGAAWRVVLRAGRAQWRPQGPDGPRVEIESFGEVGAPFMVPAPLVRVGTGTEVVISVTNDLDAVLRVHGLCSRDDLACGPLDVPAGETREIRFRAGPPGTYHYWATTTGMPLPLRGGPDSQLSGAMVFDAPGTASEDRVMVMTEWTGLTRAQLADIASQPDPGAAFLQLKPDVIFTINGQAWPHTERFAYDLGEIVRWRIINLSSQPHPMHLHGFFFDVIRAGDGIRDQAISGDRPLRAVTHLMPPASTIEMVWTPERAGQWLFHCHTMLHVSPSLHVDGSPKAAAAHDHNQHSGMGMTGLVVGIVVRPGREVLGARRSATPAFRKITLAMRTEPDRFGDSPALGFTVAEGAQPPPRGRVPVPGPVLVLRRDEPVEITLVNELPEPTSIHWHGIELDSDYDGVHGWSGAPGRTAPSVEPGGTFRVRFTPPRAGTFIYHTHLHDNRQLTSGLYGALLVVEPDAPFDEAIDHVFVIGRGGPSQNAPVVINGESAPKSVWQSGRQHRIRLINITPNDTVVATLRTATANVTWRQVAKDGAAIAAAGSVEASQTIAVGETYDFECAAPVGRQTLWLELKSPSSRWFAQGQIIVR
jgi:FtsP/CotA-like multicopper oxidase with cupredoxin domain